MELCPVSCPTVSSDVALLDAKEKGKMECVYVCAVRKRERESVCVCLCVCAREIVCVR
jgi:hypothetical protein